jgi:2'-5' RNA ligase
MISNQAERQRLFFALWPDAELANHFHQLARIQQKTCQGRLLMPEQIHLTLRYAGPVETDVANCLSAAAGRITVPSFNVQFDRLGFWSRPKVVWCMPTDVPIALQDLANCVEAACEACGLPAETRAYAPHLTLLRKARRAPLDSGMHAIVWPVQDFALVHSETRPEGAVYTVLQRWRLQPAGA